MFAIQLQINFLTLFNARCFSRERQQLGRVLHFWQQIYSFMIHMCLGKYRIKSLACQCQCMSPYVGCG